MYDSLPMWSPLKNAKVALPIPIDRYLSSAT